MKGFFRRAAQFLSLKSITPGLQAWVNGVELPDNNQGATLISPYTQSAWVYIAISVLSESIAQIPFRISRVDSATGKRVRALRGSRDPKHREFCRRNLGENIIESGDVVDLFDQPHPTMDRMLFWEMVVTWDAMRGEFFILPMDDQDQPVDLSDRKPRVRRLITLSPDMFWHMVIGYELQGWRYTGSPLLTPIPSEVLMPTEVVHSRAPNPYLYWRGMSPLQVAMLPAASDYAAEMFTKGLLMNNADTGIIATTDQNLTQDQREQFIAALRERKRKAGTPDRPLFLSSGVRIEKPTISNVDMQFLETRKLLRQEIGAIFKVPESLMGFSEAKSSSLSGGGNALNEEKMTFLEQTIQPRCHRIESAVAPIVASFGDGLIGWFDVESLPVMQEARRARVDTAVKVFGLGVPFNTLNQVYDLGFPALDWGDRGFLPFSLQPADSAGEMDMPGEGTGAPGGADESDDEPHEDDDQKGGLAPARNFLKGLVPEGSMGTSSLTVEVRKPNTKRLWERHMRQRQQSVKMFEGKVRKVLRRFRGKALTALESAPKALGLRDEDIAPYQRSLVDLIFSASEFGAALKLETTEPTRSILGTAAEALVSEVGADPWEMPPAKATEYLHSRTQAIQGTGETVRSQINTTLVEGVEAGESTADLASRVRQVFNALDAHEAIRVARTEVNMAFNFARQEAMEGVGIEYKAWLSSHGPNVREAHAAAEEDYIDDPIPVTEPFVVDGEELMFPGDDSGSPGNVINCQCVSIATEKQEKGFKFFGL